MKFLINTSNIFSLLNKNFKPMVSEDENRTIALIKQLYKSPYHLLLLQVVILKQAVI